jgi:hypothetical protein
MEEDVTAKAAALFEDNILVGKIMDQHFPRFMILPCMILS